MGKSLGRKNQKVHQKIELTFDNPDLTRAIRLTTINLMFETKNMQMKKERGRG